MAISDGRVVSNFIVQALHNDPITVYGDGGQTRSFCYVSDMIDGLVKMMHCEDFIGPVNLGNPGEFSIKSLAEMVIKMTGAKSEIVYEPLPEDDPVQRRPDISLANEKLQWKPQVPLEKGLKETVDYFSQAIL